MALSKKALQAKREKKKKKRVVKLSRPGTVAIAYNNWPIYECWVPNSLFEMGMGQILIARQNDLGDFAVGIYLVDSYCLGIKDCVVHLVDLFDYREILEGIEEVGGEMERVDPTYANTLIHKAILYAQQFGFKPHEDFSKTKNFLKNIPIDESQEFNFGKDGKPLYIPGPYDSHAKVMKIMQALNLDLSNDMGTSDYLIEDPESILLT